MYTVITAFFKKRFYYVIIAAIVALGLVYQINERIILRPIGVHIWRQCDCASMALNYYQKNWNFLEPSLHLLCGNEGKMVSEFPIIYFVVAILYKLFGYHEWLFRGVNLLVYLIGFLYLYRLVRLYLTSESSALIVSLFYLASPLLVFYGMGFLPNVPAMSIVFPGLYFLLRGGEKPIFRDIVISTLCFTLVGLLKITTLNYYFVALVMIALTHLKLLKPSIYIPKLSLIQWFLMVLPIILSVAWIKYAVYYNRVNNNTYFLLSSRAIWTADKNTIYRIFDSIYNMLPSLYWLPTLIILSLLVPITLFFGWQNHKSLAIAVIFLSIGILAEFLLFFQQFIVHDYYFVDMMPLIIVVVFFMLSILKSTMNERRNKIGKIAISVILITCIYTTATKLNYYFNNPWDDDSEVYLTASEPLRAMGIKDSDRVICMSDRSTCISLYLINLYGWTSCFDPYERDGQRLIEENKAKGAKYIILNTANPTDYKGSIPQYFNHKVGEYRSLQVYRL